MKYTGRIISILIVSMSSMMFILYNYISHNYLDIFPKLKSQSDRKAQKLIIFLIDVDDFKSINDQYDHATGDRVLQLISSTLKRTFRDSDYIVRWGGDEFLGIFPCIDESGLKELQARLHDELNTVSIMTSVDVSVSVGYAIYPDEGIGLNDLIKIADRKMYSDKCDTNNDSGIIGRKLIRKRFREQC
jgi:diguanylate cyclase (GGDEF)-like protein